MASIDDKAAMAILGAIECVDSRNADHAAIAVDHHSAAIETGTLHHQLSRRLSRSRRFEADDADDNRRMDQGYGHSADCLGAIR